MTNEIPDIVHKAAVFIASRTSSYSAEEILAYPTALAGALFAARRSLRAEKKPLTHSDWINLNSAEVTVKEWHNDAS